MLFLWRNVDEHQSLAVAPEAVLQEVGQLGVPVRDVRVLLGEGHDDVSEVGQGFVNVLGLGQPHPLAPAVLHPLAAGKINLRHIVYIHTCIAKGKYWSGLEIEVIY